MAPTQRTEDEQVGVELPGAARARVRDRAGIARAAGWGRIAGAIVDRCDSPLDRLEDLVPGGVPWSEAVVGDRDLLRPHGVELRAQRAIPRRLAGLGRPKRPRVPD